MYKSRQRTVYSKKLGRNRTKNHEEEYRLAEEKIGPTKVCKFGLVRGTATGTKHINTKTGKYEEEELDIRDFELKTKGYIQGYCRKCSQRRRPIRGKQCREKNKEGYEGYKKEYGPTKVCSMCKKVLEPEKFRIVPQEECGLHNKCNVCCKIYGESVGDRWIRYLPDGNFKYIKTGENQHDDHIMPLAVGGSNEINNHQLLSRSANLEKSATIPYENVNDIPENQICERWCPILRDSKEKGHSIKEFECKVREAIYMEQTERYNMSDEEHIELLKAYNEKNNTRKSEERAHEKFKKFYETRYLNK